MTTKTDIQIRFADVDMLRHVNNVNLQHYFDLGKNDFFRVVAPGIDVGSQQGLITARTETDFLAQTRYTDRIEVETGVEKIGNKSFTLIQRIVDKATGEVKARSLTVMVCFDFLNQQPIPVPEGMRKELERCLERK